MHILLSYVLNISDVRFQYGSVIVNKPQKNKHVIYFRQCNWKFVAEKSITG